MILCHICRNDAGTGWTIGFPPAPDSQKLGLCKEHDSPENRRLVLRAWRALLEGAVAAQNLVEAHKKGEREQILTISFNGGGAVSLPCVTVGLTGHDSLRVETDAGVTFFPLRQIQSYTIASEPGTAGGNATANTAVGTAKPEGKTPATR